jgi:choline dehydrogenase-like flavoprotein
VVGRPGDALEHDPLAGERTSMFGVMVSDESRGRVRGVFGRPQVRYDLIDRDVARFKRGIEALTDIYWAAGARQVVVPIAGVPTLRDGDSQPLRRHSIAARDLYLMAFHPLGTARAGHDPRHAVVDGDLRVHGVEGLHVADGSVVPSALGVNPQITIMALATRLGYHLVGASPPTDEPRPQRIA